MICQLHSGAASRSSEAPRRSIDQGVASKCAETVTFIYHDRGLVAAPDVTVRSSAERRDALFQQTHLKTAFMRGAAETPANKIDRRLLLLENIHGKALEIFDRGRVFASLASQRSSGGNALHEQLRDAAIIGIRSRTLLDEQAIATADGTFGDRMLWGWYHQVDTE